MRICSLWRVIMFKRWSIGVKLTVSFLMLALILLVVGGIGYFGNSSTVRGVQKMEVLDELNKNLILKEVDHLKWAGQVQNALILQEQKLGVQTDYHLCALGKWYYSQDMSNAVKLVPGIAEDLQKIEEPHKQMHLSAIKIEEYLGQNAWNDANQYFADVTEINLISLRGHLESVRKVLDEYNDDVADDMHSSEKKLSVLILISIVIGFILAILLGILISRNLSRSLTGVSDELGKGSVQLTNASLQVSSSSQELSSGASELASSVEEMTSSLEELQSIIESNTKTVTEAKVMMGDANKGSQDSVNMMEKLSVAIKDITDNSRQIERIIKVIDDIAFQTNILALNAAVEAARAGDAGRGFAVVADQVKNLAQKSAEAAKETAGLIATAIESVQKGEDLGQLVTKNTKDAGDLMGKVTQLMDEVARASQEQLKGANQVTKAVGQINSVVQNTASTSEETAAAGEELLSQAENLKGVVVDLNNVINGEKEGNVQKSQTLLDSRVKPVVPRPVRTMTLHSDDQREDGVEIIKPEDRIPMDDFKDF